ncbi:hypothetical protein [Actinomadura kijaniata]|uniref:hypothetical protein n=1 Tax=Actinomadura kijaniata TaxID=46161 RepID=UPI00082C5B3F|nr:hypothetical protein [Actinomadura kijaniata]
MTGWEFTSPLALLNEWRDREDGADLHEFLLLGSAVDLPFLERVAVPAARAMGARITVVGDAARGRYEPVDVRMAGRAYFHGLAACAGAFHPKVALLVGERDIVAAVGSGDPTMAGWGHDDELWTVLRGTRETVPAALAQLGEWLQMLPAGVAVPEYVDALLQEIAAPLEGARPAGGDVRLLHNLDEGLLGQVPGGPVDELCLYAPSVDAGGDALAEIVAHFDPARVVIGLQERWTGYDGDALALVLDGRDAEIRLLAEDVPRHGKLVEWARDGRRWALTGSADLTGEALLRSLGEGGHCELAVLSPVGTSLMPEGTACPPDRMAGRRTIREVEPRRGPSVLGALVGARGVRITLARPYDVEVAVEASPDGSPGSWTAAGTVPAGETVAVFAVPGPAGAVVRVRADLGAGAEVSPPVFAADPGRCGRWADDERPRLRVPYTEQEILTGEQGRRFRHDLLRLAERLTALRTAGTETARDANVQDRYAAWLEDHERAIGAPLTGALFGHRVDAPFGPRWGPGEGVALDEPVAGEEAVPAPLPAGEREEWRGWTSRAVGAVAPEGAAPPLPVRMLVARLFVRLLGHGVWTPDDPSWREDLARLLRRLPPEDADGVPEEASQHVNALIAVCMGLLNSGAPPTGDAPEDLPAAAAWERVRPLVADADPALAGDLLIPPVLPHARVLSRSELEGLVQLAHDDDPVAHIAAELADNGWELEEDEGVHRVRGSFTNPVPIAARVATLLGEHRDIALVQAVSGGRWAFVAWRRPDLLLASAPMGNAWRLYRLTGLATPESRLGSGDGMNNIGLVGRPIRLGQVPPDTAQRLLKDAGTDHLELLERLTSAI